ncbi:hypothetical protein AB0K15_34385 [Amycolatopsis sp. NPDC049253]|uniref:hypothetical protein n=1 Tax=Amycolatopsis sp. NPDC049253 TaxID=3155274 RepID=UPI0034389DCA
MTNTEDAGPATARRMKPRPPAAVTLAFVLWLVLVGVAVLVVLAQLLAGVQTTGSAALVVALEAGILFLAVKMRAGARWARSLLTLLTILAVLSIGAMTARYGLSFWVAPSSVLKTLLPIGQLALQLVATVSMNTPKAAPHFRYKR